MFAGLLSLFAGFGLADLFSTITDVISWED